MQMVTAVMIRRRRMKKVIFAILLLIALNNSAYAENDGRYQLVSDGKGQIYRIDTQTGRAWKEMIVTSLPQEPSVWEPIFEESELPTAKSPAVDGNANHGSK